MKVQQQRDPRAVSQIAEQWGIPEAELWARPPTFNEACAAYTFAVIDLVDPIRRALLPLVRLIARWLDRRDGRGLRG